MKKSLLFTIMIATGFSAWAQSPTTVTIAANCSVFRNFNISDEGFSSPSIYSSGDDVSFFWNAGTGEEIETSGLNRRNGSLISPVYIQTEQGHLTVGFKYVAPNNTSYRIRVISGAIGGPLEILATTANGPVYTDFPANSGNICLLLTDADLTAGTPIRLEFTYNTNHRGNFHFDDLALSVAGGPLPVTFMGFVARKNNDETVKLLWNVGAEVNVKGYYVESSINGVDFINAGYVSASGKSIYDLDYTGKLLQTTYFRVRNVDFDGRSKYTPIIKVYAKVQTDSQIQVYPVPANEQVTIQHRKTSGKTTISLISPDGKVLQQVVAVPGTFQTQININNLQNGLYFVRYDDGQGNIQISRVIKN